MVGNESCELTEHKIYRIGNPFQVIWGSIWGILNPQAVYTTGLIETAVQEGCLSDLSRNSDGMCQREKLIKLLEMFKCEKHSLPCSDSLTMYAAGDSSSIVSAVCYTVPKSAMGSSLYALESGSDFKSRGRSAESRVIFGPGVTMSTCDVMIIDDSEYEEEEEFEIALAGASDNARIGRLAVAKVLISGPNDASTVSLGNTAFTISEDAGNWEALWVSRNHLLILLASPGSCLTRS